MIKIIKKIKNGFAVFSCSQCILCGAWGKDNLSLCRFCQNDLPWLHHACWQCAVPLTTSSRRCGACLQKQPPFYRTIALFTYDDLISRCISLFKFQGSLVHGQVLAHLMAKFIPDYYQNESIPACIIPMPLHPKRLMRRGFNQAIELCRPLAKELQLPIESTLCRRVKETLSQAKTSSSESRQRNMHQAFKVEAHRYKHVAVVDDVMTTGASVAALAEALKVSGVERIDVWCCARVEHYRLGKTMATA